MDSPPSSDDRQPSFDHLFAKALLGKYVLVGITRLDADEKLISRKQFHGEVVEADAEKGFCIKLLGNREGEYEWLPPDTRAFSEASAAEYRLRSTGEVITNLDFTTVWTITEPKKDSS